MSWLQRSTAICRSGIQIQLLRIIHVERQLLQWLAASLAPQSHTQPRGSLHGTGDGMTDYVLGADNADS